MEQIVVEKRGRWKTHHWSQRLLSLSALLGVATLSQRGHVEDCHRKCLHVSAVQMWPHYDPKHLHGDFNSMEAKLTLRVRGSAVRLGERVVQRGPGEPAQNVFHYTQRNCSSDVRAWMLRFATFADLEKAVHLFRSVKVNPHSTTAAVPNGWEAPLKGFQQEGEVETVDDGDAIIATAAAPGAACQQQQEQVRDEAHDGNDEDGTPLSDSLDDAATASAGVTPSSLMDGDVDGDLEVVRSQWEQLHPGSATAV